MRRNLLASPGALLSGGVPSSLLRWPCRLMKGASGAQPWCSNLRHDLPVSACSAKARLPVLYSGRVWSRRQIRARLLLRSPVESLANTAILRGRLRPWWWEVSSGIGGDPPMPVWMDGDSSGWASRARCLCRLFRDCYASEGDDRAGIRGLQSSGLRVVKEAVGGNAVSGCPSLIRQFGCGAGCRSVQRLSASGGQSVWAVPAGRINGKSLWLGVGLRLVEDIRA